MGGVATAVIVAAGRFSRMEGINKQTAVIDDCPVLARTVLAFQQAESICDIIVVTRECDRDDVELMIRTLGMDKVTVVVKGGETRQQSVKNGVTAAVCELVAVHDGARPLVRPSVIDGTVSAAVQYGAAAAAVPVKDTVKVADDNGFVRETPDRSRLWLVQTPQVCGRAAWLEAAADAEQRGLDFTDDCQLMEMSGQAVYLYHSDYENIKITTPEDLVVAEAFLRAAK